MTRPFRPAVVAGLFVLALLAAGCGTASLRPAGRQAPAPPGLSLATTVTTAGGTWAVVVAGGAAARHNNFWQLLVRPVTGGTWRLATPPGVASNGGLVAAPSGPAALTAAFRPSQSLAFTPLATSADLGRRWSAGVLNADLARVPAALAADPVTGHMLALLATGTVEQSSNRGATWTRLTTERAISRTGPGRACGLHSLTAVAFTAAGLPLLAGTCARPGTVPVFAFSGHSWHPAGPVPPAAAASQPVAVLTMTTTAGRTFALLRAGTGPASAVTAAWCAPPGPLTGTWVLSPALALRGGNPRSVSAAGDGATAIVLSGRTGLVEPRPGAAWQPLAALPARTQSLAIGPGTAIQAIAPAGSVIAIWSAPSPGGPWTAAQHLAVPIQYGTSG